MTAKEEELPRLWNWSLDESGGITGNVSGSKLYDNYSIISTSPVTGDVENDSVVVTESGTVYILENREWDGSLENFDDKWPSLVPKENVNMEAATKNAIEEASIPLVLILLSLA